MKGGVVVATVTPEDLAQYLGTEVDEQRAQFLIEQAEALCRMVCDPLPEGAAPVVLAVTARAYTNPTGVQAETVGPYSVQRPRAGLSLTRDERRALMKLAGRGGAFTIDVRPPDNFPILPEWDVALDGEWEAWDWPPPYPQAPADEQDPPWGNTVRDTGRWEET